MLNLPYRVYRVYRVTYPDVVIQHRVVSGAAREDVAVPRQRADPGAVPTQATHLEKRYFNGFNRYFSIHIVGLIDKYVFWYTA
jgi:hypothetical protein